MAAPTPTSISTVAYVLPAGAAIGARVNMPSPPTTGQLWPRGNVT